MSIDRKITEILIEEFATSMRRKNLAQTTIALYCYEAGRFIRWTEAIGVPGLDGINKDTIRQYQSYVYYAKTQRGKPYAVSVQAGKLFAVRAFMQTMSDEGRILFNPAEDIDFPRIEYRLPKNILNEKEYARLFGAVKGNSPKSLRDRLIMNLLYLTGIRRAELAGIKLSDIDFEHSELRIDKGKGGKTRLIPLLHRTIRMTQKYIEDARPKLLRKNQTDRLLINNRARALQPRETVNHYLREYLKKAGIRKRITAHSFRHSFATALLKNGAPIRHIQRLLGHDKIQTTLIYTHLSIEDLKKAHQKYHPFENGALKEAVI